MTSSATADTALRAQLDQLQIRALAVGAAGLVVALASGAMWPADLYPAYLVGFLFWLGIALGSAGLAMLHHLTGGSWGLVIRRPLEAGATIIFPLAILFLPIAFGMSTLYPWARTESTSHDSLIEPSPYLTVPFFLIRAGIYFVIWGTLALLVAGLSKRQDRGPDPGPSRWLQTLSGPGTVLLFLAGSFSAIDWIMSLDPKWTSTIFGVMIIVGDALSTMAMMIVVSLLLASFRPMSEVATPGRLNDLGNLLLAFVMLWAYMSFCQFLIIWSGNLSEEIPWYIRRTRGGWQWVAIALIVFHFFLPFFVLLLRTTKRRPPFLLRVAAWILVMHWIDLIWLVVPAATDPASPKIPWAQIPLAAIATAGIGGIVTAVFVNRLKRNPLVPLHDPLLSQALEHAGG